MRKFFGYLMIIALFCGSICGVVFGIKLVQANNKIDNLYTQEELEQKYQDYIEQITEKDNTIFNLTKKMSDLTTENEQYKTTVSNLQNSISEKDTQIEALTTEKTSLTSQVETLNSKINELNVQIESLSQDKENNLNQINSLTIEKENLTSQVETLNSTINEKDTTIQNLTAEKTQLQEEVTNLSNTISSNETTINSLNSQISTLQTEIARLNNLLDAYSDYVNQSIQITYYVDGVLFDTQIVTRGETTSQSLTPENTDKYSFVKWQINNTDFNFDDYKFTVNTRIDAVLNYNIYNVSFKYNGEDYSSCQVYGGEYATLTLPTFDTETMEFKGVTLTENGTDYLDYTSYKITSDTIFYIHIESKYTSIQNFDSSDLKTAYSVSSVEDFSKLATLTNNGNTFAGITIYLINDLDFKDVTNWTPVGKSSTTNFMGNFNGLNHYIDNFGFVGTLSSLLNNESQVYFGLFGRVVGSSENKLMFKNLKFKNVNISIQRGSVPSLSYVGVFCSYIKYVNVSNIIFESGNISGFSGNVDNYKVSVGDIAVSVDVSNEISNCETHIEFSTIYRVFLLGGNSDAAHDCKVYSNVTDVYYLKNIWPERTLADGQHFGWNNESYGVFTNVGTVYGLPSA